MPSHSMSSFLTIVLLIFLTTNKTIHAQRIEPDGVGSHDDRSLCDKINKGPTLNPRRLSIDRVSLTPVSSTGSSKLIVQTTSIDAVCAVGVGGASEEFKPHGHRGAEGLPFSWMGQDPTSGSGSFTKMLEIQYFATNFNIIDRNANTFTSEFGGKCTCPDGTDLFVAAKLNSDCKKLNCFGGTAGACNQNQDSSWSHKVGYCGADSSPGSSAASGTTSKQLKTIDTTQLFNELNRLKPDKIYEGGLIEITNKILGGYNKVSDWKSLQDSSALDHATKITSLGESNDLYWCLRQEKWIFFTVDNIYTFSLTTLFLFFYFFIF